jgi:23S rRNA pseudouridine1911/1915/1917 synthase
MSEFEPMVIPGALDAERVDRAVALLIDCTRAEAQVLIAADEVLVNGSPVAKSRRLVEGDVVEVLAGPPGARMPEAEPIPLDVRYEDADIIVLNKPAGLVVHPGAGHADGTLVNGLLARFPDLANVGDPARPGIVHRLDRDTSGLMVVARSPEAYESLVQSLGERVVERRYAALVWGHFDAKRGMVDAPIGRSMRRRTRMAVREGGREARTGYDVEAEWTDPELSLLECKLETGRTHQIRVHLAAIGHAVLGDSVYGGYRDSLPLDRPFLHAMSLAFVHPVSGEELAFREPLQHGFEVGRERLGPSTGQPDY